MKSYIILCISLFSVFITKAETVQNADKAYKNGDYVQAIALYENLIAQNSTNSALYYNVANAYFKNQNLGKAVLNYEKSLKFHYSKDAAYNLNIVKGKLKDKIDKEDSIFFKENFQAFIQKYSLGFWTTMLIITWFSACIFFILFLLNYFKKYSFFASMLSLFFAIIFLYFTIFRNNMIHNNHYAVITQQEINLKSAPDKRSNNVAIVHEGLKVGVENENNGFYQIVLDNNVKAWVETQAVERI